MTFDPIYLDFNASTPPDPSVVAAMQAWLGSRHANPHAAHMAGQRAAAEIDKAILSIRKLINASSGEILFTSGATESNNLALFGVASSDPCSTRVLCTKIEHKSVLEVTNKLALDGVTICPLGVDVNGYISLKNVTDILSENNLNNTVVSVMHANNEIGTVQPIHRIAELKDKFNFLLHVDAAQSLGRLPLDVDEMGIDLLSFSAHKMYGPAGIGGLFVSKAAKRYLKPLLYGGGQQNGMRPGTLPVFLVAGFGVACEKALDLMNADSRNAKQLAELFCDRLSSYGVSFRRISPTHDGLPGLVSICLHEIEGEDLLLRVAPFLSISTGSACSSREIRGSHVLREIGLGEREARSVVRIGFGRSSTVSDATRAAEVIADAIRVQRDEQ